MLRRMRGRAVRMRIIEVRAVVAASGRMNCGGAAAEKKADGEKGEKVRRMEH